MSGSAEKVVGLVVDSVTAVRLQSAVFDSTMAL